MYIHFAYSGKKYDLDSQTDAVISNILEKRQLKYCPNPEFLPVFRQHIHTRFKNKMVRDISLESFKATERGAVVSLNDLEFIDPKSDIHFLPYDIKMICFIDISLKKLKNSPHPKEYGKFGIVLNDKFLRKNGIKPVQYYEEPHLFKDPMIYEWNMKFAYKSNLTPVERKERQSLEIQILAYRKPATLFESFRESRMLAIKTQPDHTEIEIHDAYNRYPIGYVFRDERECRIVSQNEEFLSFTEDDLFMIIVPDEECKLIVSQYIDENWNNKPRIEEFPSSS